MKYKAIMLDLDDTTVVHGKENLPSERVSRAIAFAKDKIHVCIATARTLNDTQLILDHLDVSGPCVLTNGAQIYDPIKKTIIHEIALPQHVVLKLFSLINETRAKAILFDGLKDIHYTRGEYPEKILSIYLPEIENKIIDSYVKTFEIDPEIRVQKLSAWDKNYMAIDITSNRASKLHGIVEVARILGIETEDIIGVGDGYNDFPLLMACGLKIAMGNAVEELKAIADFIAPSVEEDGVATVIEKFVLT